MNNRIQLFMFSVGLAFLLFTGTSFALTPKERELVQGLTKINSELRQQVAADEKAITQKDADYLFLAQKNESLAAKLEAAKKLTATQETELSLQQQKAKDQAAALYREGLRADSAEAIAKKKTLEAHRNATERDICLLIAAVFGTVLAMTYSSYIISWIVKIYPPAAPFGIGLEIAIAVISFSALYGAGRGFLALIASRL